MTLAERSSTHLQIWRVIVLTFQLIRLHLLPFLTVSIVLGIPAAILRYQDSTQPDASAWDSLLSLPFAAFVIAYTLVEAAITRMIVPDDMGHYPSLAQSVDVALRDILVLSVIGVLSTVLVVAGFFLLVIPGLILDVILSVLVPVRAVERTDIVATLVRGIALTKGQRWQILVLLIASLALEMSNSFLGDLMIGEAEASRTLAVVAAGILASTVSTISATLTAVLYCELRRIKDGPAPAALASEFD